MFAYSLLAILYTICSHNYIPSPFQISLGNHFGMGTPEPPTTTVDHVGARSFDEIDGVDARDGPSSNTSAVRPFRSLKC